ncbi:MAG: ParA family protein [Candidatus Schekmanbacteria bacterium]|nr:ParA family protein [Candidatus Schekmanbacteria bacterium]
MKIVAIYNVKGGVGKTTAAVNLAYLAARDGLRTLIWDLDPQAAATFYFRIKPKIKGGVKRLVHEGKEAGDHVRATDFEHLDMLPADLSYRKMELTLSSEKKPDRLIARIVKPLATEYDALFIDCPPSISLVTESVFARADALLVPVVPTTLSLRTLAQLDEVMAALSTRKPLVLPFFSMVDNRKALHKQIAGQRRHGAHDFLASAIPCASSVERMGVERNPLCVFARTSAAAKAFQQLWSELRARLGC